MESNELPNTYKIVFFGLIEPNADKTIVMERFASLFDIKKPATLNHLFSGNLVVIKSGISHDVANQYQAALRAIGTDCSIEPDTALGKFAGTDIGYERKKKRLVSSMQTKDLSNVSIEPKS